MPNDLLPSPPACPQVPSPSAIVTFKRMIHTSRQNLQFLKMMPTNIFISALADALNNAVLTTLHQIQ